jgi:hypothetical protein
MLRPVLTKMDISLLTDYKIQLRPGDRYFFDQYRYCLSISLHSISSLRGFDKITTPLERERSIRRQLSYRSRFVNYGGNWRGDTAPIPDNLGDNLAELVELLYHRRDQIKVTVSSNWGYIYSNDIDIIEDIMALPYVAVVGVKEAVINRPRNTVIVPKSQFQSRTYFKERWVTDDERTSLHGFLKNQTDVRICPSLRRELESEKEYFIGRQMKAPGFFLRRYHFIDHTTPAIPVMLNLILPGISRHTVQVIDK